MRRVILQQAREAGLESLEAPVAREQLLDADEVFVSNALTGIRPVRQLGDRQWNPGPVTRALAARIVHLGVDECAGNC
jgi:4-amino-4-deoxychorismate lyase